jgi:hypothetical protein
VCAQPPVAGRAARSTASRDFTLISEFVDVGGLGLALEQIADVLSEDDHAMTGDERADMLALVSRMRMDDRVPRAQPRSCHVGHPATGGSFLRIRSASAVGRGLAVIVWPSMSIVTVRRGRRVWTSFLSDRAGRARCPGAAPAR